MSNIDSFTNSVKERQQSIVRPEDFKFKSSTTGFSILFRVLSSIELLCTTALKHVNRLISKAQFCFCFFINLLSNLFYIPKAHYLFSTVDFSNQSKADKMRLSETNYRYEAVETSAKPWLWSSASGSMNQSKKKVDIGRFVDGDVCYHAGQNNILLSK